MKPVAISSTAELVTMHETSRIVEAETRYGFCESNARLYFDAGKISGVRDSTGRRLAFRASVIRFAKMRAAKLAQKRRQPRKQRQQFRSQQ